jgi:predicted Zn-dependent peptidase
MDEVASYIKSRIEEYKTAKNAPATTVIQNTFSVADEIKKFKELLDMDIITQEEFDAKKKELLGL